MILPQRKRLPHDIPLFVNVSQEVYFITICCEERRRNQLAVPSQAASLLQSIVHRNSRRVWCTHLFLIMPDHVHGLFSFAPDDRSLKETMRLWKHWTAANLKIEWQRDFFDIDCEKRKAAVIRRLYLAQPGPRRISLATRPVALRMVAGWRWANGKLAKPWVLS
jgi:REP element-mobilizing transposase RayT